jgi:hypothetical protein
MTDEEPIELLMPSASVSRVLAAYAKARESLGSVRAKSAPRIWDNIDFAAPARGLGRFVNECLLGLSGGKPPVSEEFAGDVRHHLSAELNIMGPDDLDECFWNIVNGMPATRRFRRVHDARDIGELTRNFTGLGWSGFSVQTGSSDDIEKLRRQRMFADALRREEDWTHVRVWELAEAACLIENALYVEMIAESDAMPYWQRVGAELIVRCASWNAAARAMLFARVFEAIGDGIMAADFAIAHDTENLLRLLENDWRLIAWPRIAS